MSILSYFLNPNQTLDEQNDEITVYTDGSCFHNGNKKGLAKASSAFMVYQNDNCVYQNVFQLPNIYGTPTNQKAELYAIYEALRYCDLNHSKSSIKLYTD